MSMLFKSRTVSIQFFRGLPGFLFELLKSQCLGSLLSSIRITCPNYLNLLSFMISSIFSSCVCTLTLSLLTLSFHEMPIILLWNLWCAASNFFFCATVRATILHRITLWTSLTTHTISLWVSCWYACFSIPISIFQICCLLCRFLFGSHCRNYCHLSHSCPDSKIPQSSQLQHFLFGFLSHQPNCLRSLSYTCQYSYVIPTFHLFVLQLWSSSAFFHGTNQA